MASDPGEAIPKHELLLKMLKMTTSDNDNQALVAIRKANGLLQANGWDWERLLAGKITVVGDPFVGLSRPPESRPAPAPQAAPQQSPMWSGGGGGGGGSSKQSKPFVRPAAPQFQSKPRRAKPLKVKVTLDDLGL